MKHKVSELDGALLDAAVAKAMPRNPDALPFCPSSCWEDGGPIIERERITVFHGGVAAGREWQATIGARFLESEGGFAADGRGHGPTPLIAAMRAYVASKFGEEVELP